MVIVTRSAYKKASESLSSSDISCNNIIPPWCSSGKVNVRRKSLKAPSPTWEVHSSFPLRENIWEYLYEDRSEQNCSCKRNRKARKQKEKNKRCEKTTVIMCTFLFVTVSMMGSLWLTNSIPKLNDLTKRIKYEKFTSLLVPNVRGVVDEECCYRMRYLAAALSRVEKTLRHTLRLRKAMMLTSQANKADNRLNDEYIQASGVTIGRNTVEWGGLVALWGIVPLWRAARPPHTILALRRPTPADCWPFSGAQGELSVALPGPHRVRRASIEHVAPDAARSAPRHFIIYGIAENNTWIRTIKAEYRSSGPPKQYYSIASVIDFKQIVFRVLSNQGNPKYTCLYRFHVYGVKSLIP
ncbi:sperm-associated antigen 4 protein-like [Plodia interpunctella]|uniref:sperm-associated antigen 4 protein-like n=1 Tax=Plodia interpunctella TaxID=58824 RepID=UPI0023680646|nr:sperm-associated antigen 4 protein-like [Plodia interpunctella]